MEMETTTENRRRRGYVKKRVRTEGRRSTESPLGGSSQYHELHPLVFSLEKTALSVHLIGLVNDCINRGYDCPER